MASFVDRLLALKNDAGAKNTRSPLKDPFYAESLIIQSKSIVGRMYSANEYVRFKYENRISQLVKEYRVWLAEIKREEREITAKLEAVRQEQEVICKERRDLEAIKLVAKTNRDFINHYKRRRTKRHIRNGTSVLQPVQMEKCFRKATYQPDVVQLPKIVGKANDLVKSPARKRTSLPLIPAPVLQRTKRDGGKLSLVDPQKSKKDEISFEAGQENKNIANTSVRFIKHSEQSRHVKVQVLKKEFVSFNGKEKSSDLPSGTAKQPRVLSAPKSRSKSQDRAVVKALRPLSASGHL